MMKKPTKQPKRKRDVSDICHAPSVNGPAPLTSPHESADTIVDRLGMHGYFNIREINGVVCGLHNFLFTIGLVVGLSENGYLRRYCYADLCSAELDLSEWDGVGHPSGKWIKCKGVIDGAPVDLLNPIFYT